MKRVYIYSQFVSFLDCVVRQWIGVYVRILADNDVMASAPMSQPRLAVATRKDGIGRTSQDVLTKVYLLFHRFDPSPC